MVVVVLEERSLPAWAVAAAAGGLAVIGILTKKPLERAQESFDPARRGNAHRKHLVHGKPIRVRDAAPDGPGNLGVTFARFRDPADVHSDRLPEYVPRPELERQVREQLEAHGIVVVTGGSATGKSRLAYEVVRGLHSDRFLQRPVVPASGNEGVRGLVEEGLLPKNTVFWLDGVEEYLAKGLRAEDVTALMPKGSGNVVVATMRVNPRGADHDRGENAQHVFLRRFAGNEVRVPRGNEGYTEPGSGDPRIIEAFTQDRSSVTEYLAQGPVAHQEWRRMLSSGDNQRAGAVVSAAVEARRAGRHTPLPVELLRSLHEGFVDTAEGGGAGRQTFEEALAQASAGIDGANGCLVHSDRTPGSYYAFDYLADRAQAEAGEPVGAGVLETLIEATEGPELVALGRSALRFEVDGDEAPLALAAADRRLEEDPEDPSALGLRGQALLVGVDRDGLDFGIAGNERVAEAVDHLVRAVQGGAHGFTPLLGILLHRAGRHEEAVWYLEQVDTPDSGTRVWLGRSLRALERYEEALSLLGEAKRAGSLDAGMEFAQTLADSGRADLALAEYDRVLGLFGQDEGFRKLRLTALNMKGATLFRADRVSEGIAFAEEGAARGEAWAFGLLKTYFESVGNKRMVALWTERAADVGCLWALRATGRLSAEEAYSSIEQWRTRVLHDQVDPYSSGHELRFIALVGLSQATARMVEEFSRWSEEWEKRDRAFAPFRDELFQKIIEANEAQKHSETEPEEPGQSLRGFLLQPPFFRELLVRIHTGVGDPGQPDTEEPDPWEEPETSAEAPVAERLDELRDQGRYLDVIELLTPQVVEGEAGLVEPLIEALTAAGAAEGTALMRDAVPAGRSTAALVHALVEAERSDLAERLLEFEVDAGRQWAVRELGELYGSQGRLAELQEHYRHQVYRGSHVAAAELSKYFGFLFDHTRSPGNLAWPLASFARSGGEMSASLVTDLFHHDTGSQDAEGASEQRLRLRLEAAEAGEWHVFLALAGELVKEGRFDRAEEIFFRGAAHPGFGYRPGAYLGFGKALLDADQHGRADAVLAHVSHENLSEEQGAELTRLRERSGSAAPDREGEG